MEKFLTPTLVLATLAVTATAAQAQARNCGDRARVLHMLADRYGESVRAMGLAANSGMVEVHASDETGSWTITVTMPNGVTCLVASGEAYEAVSNAAQTSGEPA